jgi:hypothetical protein
MAIARNPSEDARAALTSVVDALAQWRDEVDTSTKRSSKVVLDQIADAADALGWPKSLVDSSRTFMQQATEMQLQMIDQMLEGWQQQLKSPAPDRFTMQLGKSPGFGMPLNPMDLWMQTAVAWQRNLAEAWSLWSPDRKH